MIAANEWWAVLQNYNLTVFPAQILFYVLAIGVLVMFLTRPGKTTDRVIKGLFVLTFGWIGIVFFLVLGQKLPAHNAQAFLFLSLSALFAADLFTDTSQFRLPQTGWRRTAVLVGFGLVMVYPVIGMVQGHPASKWIVPGIFPCPTTALALVFATTTFPTKRRWLYLITLTLMEIWAIPFPIMIQIPQFGVYEDGIMLAAGLCALVMLIVNWRLSGRTRVSSSPSVV